VGEADRVSDSTGAISRIIASECIDNGGRDGGVMDGGVIGDGVARLERGERRNSPSSSGPRSSSTSLRRLLTRLAGGDSTSSGEGGGGVAVYNGGPFSQAGAAVTGDEGCGRD
jgi:hypothetical protein